MTETEKGVEGTRRPTVSKSGNRPRIPKACDASFPAPHSSQKRESSAGPWEEGLSGFSCHTGRLQGPRQRPPKPHGVYIDLLWKIQAHRID